VSDISYIDSKKLSKIQVDDNTVLSNYGFISDDFDLITIEVSGYHGKFKNSLSDKMYFVIDGEINIIANEKEYNLFKGDFLKISKNTIHEIKGNGKIIVICNPIFNPEYEEIL
jgi:mannose-6-phosphate isomerase-like protein (cupin superfamily)